MEIGTMLLLIPDSIETFLISQARAVARWGHTVTANPERTIEAGSLGSAVQGVWPSTIESFLVSPAKDLARWGWDVA
jgi:hypothetical protein